MTQIILEEPLTRLDAVPGLYGIDHEPITRQEIFIVDPVDEQVIATFGKEEALAFAERLRVLAEQIQPGTTGWDIRDGNGWVRPLRRLRIVDDELRQLDD